MEKVFGMFASKYYVKTSESSSQIIPPPVIGNVYEYTPIALYSETCGEPQVGVFCGFSTFGPAEFSPVEEKTS